MIDDLNTPQGDIQGGRTLLKDEAYTAIKTRILDEVYAPGSFLSERLLTEELSYGKSPIRHAVQRLQSDGLVTVSPQQGIVVRTLSLEDILEHFDIRIALERHVSSQLAGSLTDEQKDALARFLDMQKDQLGACTPKDAALLNASFHELLCNFFGNKQIIKVMEHQHDMLYRVIKRIYKRQPDRRYQSHQEHRALAAAIIAGKAKKAAALVVEHIEESKRFLVSL